MSNASAKNQTAANRTVDAFAPILLRDALLANLLTDDYANITYWAGKQLARQFPIETSADLPDFFTKAAFGDLTLKYQAADQQEWLLSGPVVHDRLATNPQADFSLEAGFIAQQVEKQDEAISEGTVQISSRQEVVVITILTDMDHQISALTSSEQMAMRDHFLDQAEEIAATPAPLQELVTEVVVEDVPTSTSAAVTEPTALAETSESAVSQAEPAISINDWQQTSTPAAEEPAPLVESETTVSELADPAESQSATEIEFPESESAESLSLEQSITNSLLDFGKELQQKTREDIDANRRR
ncbi:YslB family protein [Fructobacillus ficulneus]|uniref:DUF2507 domain-containing protein n=1 Tax=Fructobacillus ficulneus TaxID=157463 RepID=A0A0K8MHL2_9LACO|nr:YslB family protein [Fructobacillus ficulneus]GAP00037.1 hypothetical protein FFIC_280410 [Fructobacillus ficulneus]